MQTKSWPSHESYLIYPHQHFLPVYFLAAVPNSRRSSWTTSHIPIHSALYRETDRASPNTHIQFIISIITINQSSSSMSLLCSRSFVQTCLQLPNCHSLSLHLLFVQESACGLGCRCQCFAPVFVGLNRSLLIGIGILPRNSNNMSWMQHICLLCRSLKLVFEPTTQPISNNPSSIVRPPFLLFCISNSRK